jgi:hypothetical protein
VAVSFSLRRLSHLVRRGLAFLGESNVAGTDYTPLAVFSYSCGRLPDNFSHPQFRAQVSVRYLNFHDDDERAACENLPSDIR